MKTRPSAILHGLCVVACALLCGCFEEPPPVEQGTSEGSTASETLGSTSGPPTGTSGDKPASTSGLGSTGDNADVGSGETSSVGDDSTSTGTARCGDGVVDDGEMCDATPGCDGMCRFTDYACNPLNDAGCDAPQRCGLFDIATEQFACMPAGPQGVGDECDGSGANDVDCDAGLTCIFSTQTILCPEFNCCVHYCDMIAGTGCADFEICAQFLPMPMHQGLEHLGFCFSRR